MVAPESLEVARRGQDFYERQLRARLEATHRGSFVSIEPDSGDFFLGRTLEEAITTARRSHPDRLSYTCRIGFPTAVEIGCSL